LFEKKTHLIFGHVSGYTTLLQSPHIIWMQF